MSEVFTKDINRGLQLYLPLNEIVLDADQEKEVVDISGARLNGKVNGATVVADSKLGHCIYFDGVDDYIEMPEMNVDYSQGLTVAAWVHYNSFKRWSRIIDFGNAQANDNIVFGNELTTNNLALVVLKGSNSDNRIKADGRLELNQWLYVTVTVDGSGSGKIYKNGEEVQSGLVHLPNTVNRTKNYIGKSNWSVDKYFHGQMSNLRLYNRGLSKAEINECMKIDGRDINLGMRERSQKSYSIRVDAAELARSRQHPIHEANGDEQRYGGDKYFMSFTKGLIHNPTTGLLEDPKDFVEFRRAIDNGFIDPFTDRVRHGAKYKVNDQGNIVEEDNPQDLDFRQWEAPTAGVVHELEGPDAQAVTIPPAPPLLDSTRNTNPELIFEMAEVYELAILRDVPLNNFDNKNTTDELTASIARLNNLDYVKNQNGRPRKVNQAGELDLQTVFRGSSPGVEVGPYLSQFLLIGNKGVNGVDNTTTGRIAYGVQQIDQRVPVASLQNYMTQWENYVKVQRGIKQERETYVEGNGSHRFIYTPRDLATYVHYDALYQAYLNACFILLGMGTPFDPSFDHLSGGGEAAKDPKTRPHAGGFALYAGPHILTLVTEVATRALKAIRFQKFNNHIRLRPEALAARIDLVRRKNNGEIQESLIPQALSQYVHGFIDKLGSNGSGNLTTSTLGKIAEIAESSYLLPMAFPEGSPMHPAYGAGHATVAGACVTILKAFFDTSTVLIKDSNNEYKFKHKEDQDQFIAFRTNSLGTDLITEDINNISEALTLEGELNKLAANISIGRNMAGVHYFSDYYDSIRMGEQIAIGILQEQALTYSTDPFVMSVPTFDGNIVRIGY